MALTLQRGGQRQRRQRKREVKATAKKCQRGPPTALLCQGKSNTSSCRRCCCAQPTPFLAPRHDHSPHGACAPVLKVENQVSILPHSSCKHTPGEGQAAITNAVIHIPSWASLAAFASLIGRAVWFDWQRIAPMAGQWHVHAIECKCACRPQSCQQEQSET